MGIVAFRAFEDRNAEEGAATNQLYRAEKTVPEEPAEATQSGWGLDDRTHRAPAL